jgi:hypothetical protein
VGDDAVSIVSGRILRDGRPVAGQELVAGRVEDGDPIGDFPAQSDDNGNFQINMVCDGRACDGPARVWIVNERGDRVSPYVGFEFGNQCRRGTVNFRNP